MPVRIVSKQNHIYIVEWKEVDNYSRDRTFMSYQTAIRFAAKLEARLLLDELKDLAS